MMMFIFIPLAQGQGSSSSPETKDLLLPQPAPRGTAEATLGWGCFFERRSSPNLLPTQSEGMEHLALQHLVLMMFQNTPKRVQVLRHLVALLGQCIWQLRGLKSGKDQIFTGAVQFLTQIECAATQHGQHRIWDPVLHKQGAIPLGPRLRKHLGYAGPPSCDTPKKTNMTLEITIFNRNTSSNGGFSIVMLVFWGVSFLTELLAEDGLQDLFEGDEFEPQVVVSKATKWTYETHVWLMSMTCKFLSYSCTLEFYPLYSPLTSSLKEKWEGPYYSYLSIYLSTYLPIYLSIYLSICPFIIIYPSFTYFTYMYSKLKLTSMQRPLRKRRAGRSSLVDSWSSTIWDSSHALKVHEQEIQDSFLRLLWTIGGQSINIRCDRNQKDIHTIHTIPAKTWSMQHSKKLLNKY